MRRRSNPRPWTPQEVGYLRAHVAEQSHAQIGLALGRPAGAVKSYATAHGITAIRPWEENP
jgi:hypothetical protein